KIGDHFRRAAGKIDGRNVSFCQPIDDSINRLARNDLLALGTCIHMAMDAGEIAKLTHVDLKNFGTRPTEGERTFGKCLGESIHYKSAATAAVAVVANPYAKKVVAQLDIWRQRK